MKRIGKESRWICLSIKNLNTSKAYIRQVIGNNGVLSGCKRSIMGGIHLNKSYQAINIMRRFTNLIYCLLVSFCTLTYEYLIGYILIRWAVWCMSFGKFMLVGLSLWVFLNSKTLKCKIIEFHGTTGYPKIRKDYGYGAIIIMEGLSKNNSVFRKSYRSWGIIWHKVMFNFDDKTDY